MRSLKWKRALVLKPGDTGAVAWSSDGSLLAAGCRDGAVRVWDARTGKVAQVFSGHQKQVLAVAWSPVPGARIFASSAMDNTVRLWTVGTASATRVLSGHHDIVRSVAWSPDGTMIASGSDDMTVRLWDPVSGELDLMLGGPAMSDAERMAEIIRRGGGNFHGAPPGQRGHTDYVTALAWSPEGKRLASGSYDMTVRLWTPGGSSVESQVLRLDNFVFAMAWPVHPGLLTTVEEKGHVRVWQRGEQRTAWAFNCGLKHISSIAWSPDGALMAIAAFDQPKIRVFSATGELRAEWDAHRPGPTSVAWSPDGGRLASAGHDGRVQVWVLRY